MAAEKPFVGALTYLQNMGVYEVVLPFLLIFTLTYAVLDKTKVLGVETIGDKQYPKKNVNAIVALVIAFFTLASAKILQIITELSQWIILILFSFFLFFLLAGSFQSEDKLKNGFFLPKGWNLGFMILSLGVVVFFVIFFIIMSFSDPAAVGRAMGSIFSNEDFWSMITFLGITIGAVAVVISSGNKKK